ncbi:MAG: bifunctional 1-(5-phosphoribosyl)-5-((5-phosphoribosylamino)methylideneamino)imidazole-4-carboxamide isomerase/phosphoribosylanthranilate isomerase PriA [Actinomycetota bacterium]|nr:bifunctional 1-(5-phosphoribosyl)-5-((5-phosphoribosylamino)methylideneamino)imidazole-4-carboxamide isomerase/phosphoribosylanthranilate isomerase PriA [Actinomycetota bacterium]
MKILDILPAIDVKEGSAIRLVQGELDKQSKYGNPLEIAAEFVAAGASWIHLVDLDAAFGLGNNFEVLASVIKSVDIKIELSGGIRDDESLERALSTGCTRINLGTAALEQEEWTESVIKKHGDKIAVGLDVRGRELSARGWTKSGGDLFEAITRLFKAGHARYVLTDITRDGTLTGPNLELLKEVTSFTKTPIVASGGISSLTDVKALTQLTNQGVEGVIIGKALYAGAFTLAQVLATARGE